MIVVNVATALFYPAGEAKTSKKALDAFTPVEAGNKFAEVEFAKVTACNLLKGKKIIVSATGEEIPVKILNGGAEETVKRKCGVLAEVGKLSGGVFEVTKAGALAKEGALNFPTTAIASGEFEEGTKFKSVKCSLTAGEGAVVESGLSKVETEPAEEFGWTNS